MRHLRWLVVLVLLLAPVAADPDPVEETRLRVIGLWTPSRGYYTIKSGGGPPEMVEYKVSTRVNADGTWLATDARKGKWSVEEPDVIILDPKTLNERMFKITFMGDEMARKGPYLRDGKLSRAGVTYMFFENISQEAPKD